MVYRGKGAVNKFVRRMLEEVKYCKNTIMKHFNKDMILTVADKASFKDAEKCHICDGEYTDWDPKVRDHCHATGGYSANWG